MTSSGEPGFNFVWSVLIKSAATRLGGGLLAQFSEDKRCSLRFGGRRRRREREGELRKGEDKGKKTERRRK